MDELVDPVTRLLNTRKVTISSLIVLMKLCACYPPYSGNARQKRHSYLIVMSDSVMILKEVIELQPLKDWVFGNIYSSIFGILSFVTKMYGNLSSDTWLECFAELIDYNHKENSKLWSHRIGWVETYIATTVARPLSSFCSATPRTYHHPITEVLLNDYEKHPLFALLSEVYPCTEEIVLYKG